MKNGKSGQGTGPQYIDKRGWKYKVMPGLGDNTFKARYQKAGMSGADGWKCCAALPWRSTFEEAQRDLDQKAEKQGWRVWVPG